MLIYLKGCYNILGNIFSSPKEYRFRFKVPFKEKELITVDILSGDDSVESIYKREITEKMWQFLQTDEPIGKLLSPEVLKEFFSMKSDLSKATKKVLHLIKYCLNCTDLNDNLCSNKGIYWSIDNTKWKKIFENTYATISIKNITSLKEKTAKAIQEYIDSNFEPFFALKHLHKAKNENSPRYKWIDATIAAELAIKEFLIRLEPNLETLLLEVPSPPLYKLYGSILKSFTNEASPKVNQIKRGVEIRNVLIHKPNNIEINTKQANEYIHDVEMAIYHLLNLLYPGDSTLKISVGLE